MFKECFKNQHYSVQVEEMMPLAHCISGIRGKKREYRRRDPSLSFLVFMMRKSPKGWVLSSSFFPMVQEGENPDQMQKVVVVSGKLLIPPGMTKRSPKRKKEIWTWGRD